MKKGLLVVGALAIAIATVPMFAAFEAHVINVTAHIENALTTHGGPVVFGTVFPQEYVAKDFGIELSRSFQGQKDAYEVNYKIVQKSKCWNNDPQNPEYAPVDYATDLCPKIGNVQYVAMNDLCKFLSKLPEQEEGDVGVPSYFQGPTAGCVTPTPEIATGSLNLNSDMGDEWTVDLKVPPVAGYVGQDWPANCANYTVPTDGADYGCDLWVEVTGIKRLSQE